MAHHAIGHDGAGDLQDLVVLCVLLDELDYLDATPESIHTDLEAIAVACLAHPDPWARE